jgi:hypothetical protein
LKGKPIRGTADFSTELERQRRHGIIYFKPWKKVTANLAYCT